MKEGIHPQYKPAKILCACGNEISTRSTAGDFHIEICSSCHPFFTGKQKIMDTAGRIERFKNRYAAKPEAAAAEPAKAKKAAAAPKAEPKKAEAPKENRAAKRAKTAKPKKAEAAAEPKAEGAGETPAE